MKYSLTKFIALITALSLVSATAMPGFVDSHMKLYVCGTDLWSKGHC